MERGKGQADGFDLNSLLDPSKAQETFTPTERSPILDVACGADGDTDRITGSGSDNTETIGRSETRDEARGGFERIPIGVGGRLGRRADGNFVGLTTECAAVVDSP